ncbi:MAG: hypothetical protein RML46_02555 [Anaerolineae bacterium]|nr:hypothetical protein [Anaerolineae bacterium]MDW8067777.1 hypothetical protein [Anaerolineae bacterium]
MDFLNIGSGEFFFLVLLAILLVGPKRAVEWTQQAVRLMARIRQEWLAVQRDVVREVQALQQETVSTLQPALQEVVPGHPDWQQEVAETVQPIRETAREIQVLQTQVASLTEKLKPTSDFAG